MKKIWIFLIVFFLIAGLSFIKFSYDLGPLGVKHYAWNYKMTVQVETPEGIKTGYAVREVTVEYVPKEIQGLRETRAVVRGEAVVVDLGKRGMLFALLKGYKHSYDHDYQIVFDAFPGPPGFTKEGLEFYSHLKNDKATLTPDQYPLLVTFANIDDPKSIKGVFDVQSDGKYPAHYTFDDHIEKTFGQGVRLKSIQVEMTNERASYRVEKIISWFSDWKKRGGTISGQVIFQTIPSFEKDLITSDFIKR